VDDCARVACLIALEFVGAVAKGNRVVITDAANERAVRAYIAARQGQHHGGDSVYRALAQQVSHTN
jgi:hypothetical protein